MFLTFWAIFYGRGQFTTDKNTRLLRIYLPESSEKKTAHQLK